MNDLRRRIEKALYWALFIWLLVINLYIFWGLATGLDWTTDPILGVFFR
jgi:hypothetical protein